MSYFCMRVCPLLLTACLGARFTITVKQRKPTATNSTDRPASFCFVYEPPRRRFSYFSPGRRFAKRTTILYMLQILREQYLTPTPPGSDPFQSATSDVAAELSAMGMPNSSTQVQTGIEQAEFPDGAVAACTQNGGDSNGQPSSLSEEKVREDSAYMDPSSNYLGSTNGVRELVLTKTSHTDGLLHDIARATLAKHRFQKHTIVGENGPNVDLTSVQIPQKFKGFLKYDETLDVLPRGTTFTSIDLSKHSYIRDRDETLPQSKKNQDHTLKNDVSNPPAYVNATGQTVIFVDQRDGHLHNVIEEGYLVKKCTSWKPKVEGAQVMIYQFFLVKHENANKVKALLASKRSRPKDSDLVAAAGSGAFQEHLEANDADSPDETIASLLGPSLCVALPTQVPDLSAAGGKRKAANISENDIEDSIHRLLVEKHGFLSQSQGDSAERDLKNVIQEGLKIFLGGLRRQHEEEGRWPDYVFEPDFLLPSIQAIFKQSIEQKHMPGVVPEARVKAGDFDPKREIKSVLHYVEIFLHWFQSLDKRIEKLESQAQVDEVKRTFEQVDGAPPKASEPAKIWAKKYCTEPRPYQTAAIQECETRNTIVCLPTGKGKTLIAITAIDHFLVQAPGKKALFIVPTRALVDQQAKALRSFSKSLPIGTTVEQSFTMGVAELCGQEMDGWTEQHWVDCLRQNRVLVGTPDVFKKAFITNRFLDIKSFSVIVFDECHAAVGNSAMSEIMRNAVSGVSAEARPRIIGLTASFINGSVTDQTAVTKRNALCETLQGNLFVPDVPEVQLRHFKRVEWEHNPLPMDDAVSTAEEFVAPLLSPLQAVKRVKDPEKIARSAGHVLWQLGCSGFRFYMMEGLVIELEAAAKKLAELKGVDFVHQRTKGEALLDQIAEVKRELNNRLESMAQTGPALVVGERTKKAEALLALLQTIQTSDANGQGIIFCARNCLVHPLKQLCQQIGLRVGAVAGVSHMTDARRRDVLKQFATQQLDLLVATNAVEEGLDIPDCRFVIRFDKFDTTKSHIQGSGRARMEEAAIYYFENEIEAEHQKEQLLDSVARDTNLDLAEEDLLSDGSRWTIPGKYPYPSSSPAEEPESGLVLFSNCLGIFSEYCGKVLGPSGPSSFTDFLRYASNGQGSPVNLKAVLESATILERCRFPSPEGWQDVCRAEVEDYWGRKALVDQMVKGGHVSQEKRFLFVVIVKMRERGFLDIHNEPSAHALQNSKRECPLPVFDSSVSLTPKFARTVEAAAAVATAEVWTEEDYTSKLNLECQRRFGNAFKLSYSYEQMPYQGGGFMCTITMTSTPADPPRTFSASRTPYRAQKCARKCAAKLAFQALITEDATPASEPSSPATSSSEPGTPPSRAQDFKSHLNLHLQKKGAVVKYETVEEPKGVFASVAVIAALNQRFGGQPCKNKKEAEQSAARAACDSLSRDGEITEDATPASEPSSPATSSSEPGTPPSRAQDFKSHLNLHLQKKGAVVKYETVEEPKGVFASVAVIAALNQRFGGQPCKNKKEAEQSAARAACDSLSHDGEWVFVQ